VILKAKEFFGPPFNMYYIFVPTGWTPFRAVYCWMLLPRSRRVAAICSQTPATSAWRLKSNGGRTKRKILKITCNNDGG